MLFFVTDFLFCSEEPYNHLVLLITITTCYIFCWRCLRFTELFLDELEDASDLRLLVKTYLQSLSGVPINGIVEFYQNVRQKASKYLADGTGRRPHFRLFCHFAVHGMTAYDCLVSYYNQISTTKGFCKSPGWLWYNWRGSWPIISRRKTWQQFGQSYGRQMNPM